jgi:hypothetical protein
MQAANPATDAGRDAKKAIASWTGEMTADSAAPLIFMAWYRELSRLVYADELGDLFSDGWEMRSQFMISVMKNQGGLSSWCDNVNTKEKETCAERAGRAFDLAAIDLARRYGERSTWRWGRAHFAASDHRPFGFFPVVKDFFNIAPETPGDSFTVNVGHFFVRDEERPFTNRHAASLRAIYDLADLDRSVYMHSTGQSGTGCRTGTTASRIAGRRSSTSRSPRSARRFRRAYADTETLRRRRDMEQFVRTSLPKASQPARRSSSPPRSRGRSLRAIADDFGPSFIASARPLLANSPGPLVRDDPRASPWPAPEKIATGESMWRGPQMLDAQPLFNGRRILGFCYGGPYAILDPSAWASTRGSRATAPRCSTTSASSRRSASLSAFSGATRTRWRPRRCSRPIAPRRACRMSSCTWSPASSTAT